MTEQEAEKIFIQEARAVMHQFNIESFRKDYSRLLIAIKRAIIRAGRDQGGLPCCTQELKPRGGKIYGFLIFLLILGIALLIWGVRG